MRTILLISMSLGLLSTPLFSQDNSRGTTSDWKQEEEKPYETKNSDVRKSVKMSRRQFKKTYLYWFYDHHEKLREDFYKRKRKMKKGYRRMARIMNKPQYRDHAYFGHKRKPKIREVGKRKFCSECGIVH